MLDESNSNTAAATFISPMLIQMSGTSRGKPRCSRWLAIRPLTLQETPHEEPHCVCERIMRAMHTDEPVRHCVLIIVLGFGSAPLYFLF